MKKRNCNKCIIVDRSDPSKVGLARQMFMQLIRQHKSSSIRKNDRSTRSADPKHEGKRNEREFDHYQEIG